jgi:hypothetical protein
VIVTFRIPAPEGDHFAPGCLDSQVGTWQKVAAPGLQAVRALLVSAMVLPGGEQAELTADIPGDCGTARVVSRAGGGGQGPFIVRDDGTVALAFQIRRRDPAEAAKLMREGLTERGWPAADIDSAVAGMQEP